MTTMSGDTCIVMAVVLPMLLLPIVLNAKDMKAEYRRGAAQQVSAFAGSVAGLLGLILVVLGVQTDGLRDGFAVIAWTSFVVELVAVALVFVVAAAMSMETDGRTHDGGGRLVPRLALWRFPWERAGITVETDVRDLPGGVRDTSPVDGQLMRARTGRSG